MQAFQSLVGYCTGYGGKYNPGRQNLRIENLQAQLDAVRQALEKVKVTKVHFNNEVNARKQEFRQLPALAASVMRVLAASGVSEEKLEDARYYFHGIVGFPTSGSAAKKSEAAAQPEPTRRSSHSMTYANKVAAFEQLVQTVVTEPLYQVNEETLSIDYLTAKAAELRQLNQRVIDAQVEWSNARLERNRLVRDDEQSLVKTARAVKNYLGALFGYNSLQYEQVKKISFH